MGRNCFWLILPARHPLGPSGGDALLGKQLPDLRDRRFRLLRCGSVLVRINDERVKPRVAAQRLQIRILFDPCAHAAGQPVIEGFA